MEWKEYRTGEVFNFDSSNGIFHACNIKIENKKTSQNHPYVVRTSQNNGIRGYISEDENKLNPMNTISFAQDTAQMFYQEEPYFTGNKIKVLSVKGQELTRGVALFLISCLNKSFNNFAWGSSYDTNILKNTPISLPVKTVYKPDFALMAEIVGGGTTMIDTSSWKEFKLEDILQKVDTQKISLKKSECSSIKTDEYDLPARTATTQNHGLSCYVPRDYATVLNNCISVSANGDYCAFWHDSEFTILQDSYALCGNGFKLTEKVALFLVGCMDRAFSSKYNWNNKSGWEKLRKEYIKLPVTESEEIDWSYMQERIEELEQERIEELEQERIEELEQYLIATGLNDYELTDEDKAFLASFNQDLANMSNDKIVNN